MPFKLPRPTYDPELVADIEDYLDQLANTEIIYHMERGLDGWEIQRAAGRYKGTYSRPMFETFEDGVTSAIRKSYPDPCPACDDWSRTSKCTEHYEIAWQDGEFKGPVAEPRPVLAYHSPEMFRTQAETVLDRMLVDQYLRRFSASRGTTVYITADDAGHFSYEVQGD